ncbi:hypothetical protein M011DRAFT_470254 [Sporormia fimetaria CBS 119925]|uniref:Uncharacterized protein n=1 Tax=Sporormia fimetaria CBS 119925 TaxID=1340428 RepID=A0A6A6V465_9PLEO|nr:hypothetical protein M011DRAFT_470254 [Sporormia fimetaria CBS 119925]
MSESAGPICKARLLSDPTAKTECDQPATSLDGRFCPFHSRQCQGLYRGYKRRNSQLDTLAAAQPEFLSTTKFSLVNQTFQTLTDKETLNNVFQYLFRRYNLLERVIRGRKLHHSHFFAIDHDYGHEKYLRQLQNEKQIVSKALERLGKQISQVLYKEKSWASWVRERQDEEESTRENESQKVKLEAQLFRRHQKEIARRQREQKEKERQRLQDVLLEQAYTEKMSESAEAQDAWDPIQDVVEDDKANYKALIEYFLMLKDDEEETETEEAITNENVSATPMSKAAKKRAKKAKTPAKPPSGTDDKHGGKSDTIEMETRSQIRKRLQEGVVYARQRGFHILGSLETPPGLYEKSAPIPDEEIDVLLEEIAEVKMLLFCRLLLSQASLLPTAVEANSVEEFLDHAEVTMESLRDLCLKVERPSLQDVRDACADFVRAKGGDKQEDSDDDADTEESEEHDEEKVIPSMYDMSFAPPDRSIPSVFKTKREQALQREREQKRKALGDVALQLPELETEEKGKRVRIKICGRYINHYPSEKALPRGGWYHFCIIAKDSDLHDAIQLCRNWNEFFELNTLCLYHYFPASKWMVWVGDQEKLQLLRLGFIPYFQCDRANLMTMHHQTGSRGLARRSHCIREARNFICGHIKRNDAASRRLIQYLSMMTFELILLVRDAKTGKILVKPPKEERWLVREKVGWGRASRNEYEVLAKVDAEFFEKMDKQRKWHFSFDDHYDLYIWDATTHGRSFDFLYQRLVEALIKAHRVEKPRDLYNVVAPILTTLTADPTTQRVRSIRPGEEAESLLDKLDKPDTKYSITVSIDPDNMNDGKYLNYFDRIKYNEADALEDEILFPEEADGEPTDNLFRADNSLMTQLEQGRIGDIRRFACDLDSDEDTEDAFSERLGSDENMMDDEEANDEDDWMDEDDDEADGWMSNLLAADQRQEPKPMPEVTEEEWDELSAKFSSYLSLGSGFTRQHYDRQRSVFNFNELVKPDSPMKHFDLSFLPAKLRENDEDTMAALRFSFAKAKDYNDMRDEVMRPQWERFITRRKAKIFKQAFHQADWAPDTRRKWFIQESMIRQMDEYQMSKLTLGPFEMIRSMGLMEKMPMEETRIVDDVFRAYAAISLFYEGEEFMKSRDAALFSISLFKDFLEEHPFLNQEARAKQVPNRRTAQCNKMLPADFFAEWDRICRANNREMEDGEIDHFYPCEWDKAVRPKLARLYKAGIICNSYSDGAAGTAIAHAEPGRDLDLYMDYRLGLGHITRLPHLVDPRDFSGPKLLGRAQNFTRQHPDARFAVLRTWSSEHFYPLMLGYENRLNMSFLDGRGRAWEWKFIPKDMPFSEWSIHEQLRLRIKPFEGFFGDRVVVAMDMFLVMGRDAEECRMLAAATTFAAQTEPWRMEIDFWRSFVGVDVGFLEGLDARWLETVREG